MRKITIKKVHQHELEALQEELRNFIITKNALLLPLRNKTGYFEAVLLMDIAQKMYYYFQSKIQRFSSKTTTLNFQANEAVVILQCLSDSPATNPNDTSNRFLSLLYTELINLSTTINHKMALRNAN